MPVSGKIDVHHHVYPPIFTEALNRNGGDPSGWYVPDWTEDLDQEACHKIGVSTAILSPTAPGPGIEKDRVAAAKLARNATSTALGFEMQDPREIAYALDELKADGIILLTSYGESAPLYLGHEKFVPVWKALNARQAVVFVHPTHAAGSTQVSKYLPQPSFDYPHETGRTAIDLILSGMLQNHAQNCKIILSHAGGTLPYLIDRTAGMAPYMPEAMNPGLSRDQILEQARWFFYDTALSSSPMHLRALMALLGSDGKSHVIFGSDFPNAPPGGIEYFTAQLEASEDVVVTDLRKNALALFPRLR